MNKLLMYLTILGMLLMYYGVVNHLRKNESARNMILKHLSPQNQEKFLDFLAPQKGPISMERAKADLTKIRSYDEKCGEEGADQNGACRMAEKPRLGEKFDKNLAGKTPLGDSLRKMQKIESAKFDEFKKIDEL